LEAKQYAVESGFSQATHNFVQGHIYLYETKLYKFGADDSGTVLTDGMLEPTGKTDGQFQVYYLFVNEDFPKVHREIQQAFVDAYNQQMRRHFEHLNGLTKTIFVFRCTNCIRILI
jgi:ABC-type nitrate/sulfonate/bicarbonate transport system substrate-binding protein